MAEKSGKYEQKNFLCIFEIYNKYQKDLGNFQ